MPVEIRATFLIGTQRAIHVEHNGEQMWLPKSQISGLPMSLTQGQELSLTLTDWIARQKNITAADAPVNEDRYTVHLHWQGGVPDLNVDGIAIVDNSTSAVMCWCANERSARMIAAALALTEGKV